MTTTTTLKKLAAVLGALTLTASLALIESTTSDAQPGSAARPGPAGDRSSPLVGTWRMTSLELGTPGNLERVPYSGEIIFTRAGTVSVQAMNPDRSAPDTPFTVDGYEAYYASVAVNAKARTFVMTVQSAAVRNLIGQKLPRAYTVTRNQLVLEPTNPADGFRATYKRI